MAKPSFTFTIDCGPGTLWKCKVFVWPSKKAMHTNHPKKNKSDSVAFCRQHGATDAWNKQLACEMHFNRRDLKRGYVVHEAVHAAIAWAKLVKLDINTRTGDEAMAESVEHLTEGALYYLKRRKIKF